MTYEYNRTKLYSFNYLQGYLRVYARSLPVDQNEIGEGCIFQRTSQSKHFWVMTS